MTGKSLIGTRIWDIMQKENLNYRSFGSRIGFSDVVVGNVVKGRNKPSYDFIENLIQTFDWVNLEWLLTGEGSMKKSDYFADFDKNQVVNEPIAIYNSRISHLEDLLKEKDKQLELLMESRDQYKMLADLFKDKYFRDYVKPKIDQEEVEKNE